MERKPNGYWTKERVFEKAKSYKTRTEFAKGCPRAYTVALKNGWLSEMDWFVSPQKTRNYWTKERVFEKAKKYNSKVEFAKGCKRAYEVARKNGWLKEMNWFKRPVVYNKKWTKEKVFEVAKTCKTRSEFSKKYGSAYQVANINGWLDEMTWFVEGKIEKYTQKNDSVYRYFWEETNAIYIGRTLIAQQNVRHNAHSTSEKDTVFRYAKENGLEVPPMEIIEENITPIEALEREDYWVNYYKKKGYNVLNKAKTGVGSGSLGGIDNGKWTKEKVFEVAKTCKTRTEFWEKYKGAYRVALENGWLDEMDWFEEGRKTNNYWDIKDNVFEAAKTCKTRSEFCKKYKGAYNAAYKNGWIEELFPKCEDCRKKPWNKGKPHSEQTKRKMSETKKGVPNLKLSKAVLQIDKVTGLVINEFSSLKEVERQLGFNNSNISACCLGKRNTCGGFIWRFNENVA